jgi:hypothetical protein
MQELELQQEKDRLIVSQIENAQMRIALLKRVAGLLIVAIEQPEERAKALEVARQTLTDVK